MLPEPTRDWRSNTSREPSFENEGAVGRSPRGDARRTSPSPPGQSRKICAEELCGPATVRSKAMEAEAEASAAGTASARKAATKIPASFMHNRVCGYLTLSASGWTVVRRCMLFRVCQPLPAFDFSFSPFGGNDAWRPRSRKPTEENEGR